MKITVRKGQMPDMLDRPAFGERFRQRFADPAFDAERDALGIEGIAWQGYHQYRKSPRSRPAGAGFAEPDVELAEEWLATRERLRAAQQRWAEPATAPRATTAPARARCPRPSGWRRSRVRRSPATASRPTCWT